MTRFITGIAEVKQSTKKQGKWCTKKNQLFVDDDNSIYLVPRNYITDGYTIPRLLAFIAGGKMQYDIRPAIGHDLECQYHQEILVKLSTYELEAKGFLVYKDGEIICKDIPKRYLEIRKTTFNSTNSKFKRMMKATENISNFRLNTMRFAVNFNIGWLFTGKEKIDINNVYGDK